MDARMDNFFLLQDLVVEQLFVCVFLVVVYLSTCCGEEEKWVFTPSLSPLLGWFPSTQHHFKKSGRVSGGGRERERGRIRFVVHHFNRDFVRDIFVQIIICTVVLCSRVGNLSILGVCPNRKGATPR